MNEDRRKLIVVLGMHRSGTSVITRGLSVMGVDLGSRLMPPFEGNNAKGFFEDLDIYNLNIEMLHSLRSDWHFLTPIQSADVDTLRKNGYLQRAVELLQEKTAVAKVFGFKDPRATKLLPFWKEVFAQLQIKVGYVLVVRHPLSVCESLAKRDGFENEKSHILWLGHTIGGLVDTANENCAMVDYDRLMQTPEIELAKIASVLQLQINEAEFEKFKVEFLDQRLRHTVYQLEDLMLNETVPPLTREVYKEVLKITIDNTSLENEEFQKKITQWNNEFLRQKHALILADKLTLQIYQIMGEQKQITETLTAQLVDKEQILKSLFEQVQELNEVKQSRAWNLLQGLRKIRWSISHHK